MDQRVSGFDTAVLRRAIEGNDAEALAGLYAQDAVLRIIDRSHTPSAPLELRGREAIAALYRDICGRAMTHRIEDLVADGDRVSFTEACAYPDGLKVFCAAMIALKDGRIVRQTNVQAWDE